MNEDPIVETPIEFHNIVENRYVAFCDILGFSDKILNHFEETLKVYKDFCQFVSKIPLSGVKVTIYSDAILITGETFRVVCSAVQSLWFSALSHDLMIRGAITKGRYWEQQIGNHMFVASDALVRAVKLEKAVGVPAVFIADDIEIPDENWLERFVRGVFEVPILQFRDRNIINPFNRYWFASARMRASMLMAESPSHQDKYLWFLQLHDAVKNQQELIPSSVLAKFINDGILKKKSNTSNQVISKDQE